MIGKAIKKKDIVSFRNEDVSDCAVALSKALEMGEMESNYQTIVKKYGNDIWCKKIFDIYKKIIWNGKVSDEQS